MRHARWLRITRYGEWKLVLGISGTTIGRLGVTDLTPPVDSNTLRNVYRKVQPGGSGWRKVMGEARVERDESGSDQGWDVPIGILCTMLDSLGIRSALFAIGNVPYDHPAAVPGLALLGAMSLGMLRKVSQRLHVR